jgi:hypothetical protein
VAGRVVPVAVPAGPTAAARAAAAASSIFDRALALLGDAWSALKLLAKHPAGAVPSVLQTLGPRRSLRVGIFYAAIFDLLTLLVAAVDWPLVLPPGQGAAPLDYLKTLVWGALPFAWLWAACRLARKMWPGTAPTEGDALIAGACLLPLYVPMVVLALFGATAPSLLAATALLGFSYALFILASGWIQLLKVPEAKATWAAPLVLLVLGGILKYVFTNLF